MHVHSQKRTFEDGGGSIREGGRRLKTSTCSSAKGIRVKLLLELGSATFNCAADSGPISRARRAFRSWYRCTSICGISNARDSSAAWESLLWIAVFLGAAVFTGVQERIRKRGDKCVYYRGDYCRSSACLSSTSDTTWTQTWRWSTRTWLV